VSRARGKGEPRLAVRAHHIQQQRTHKLHRHFHIDAWASSESARSRMAAIKTGSERSHVPDQHRSCKLRRKSLGLRCSVTVPLSSTRQDQTAPLFLCSYEELRTRRLLVHSLACFSIQSPAGKAIDTDRGSGLIALRAWLEEHKRKRAAIVRPPPALSISQWPNFPIPQFPVATWRPISLARTARDIRAASPEA
jgi:hypothetical protein